jgi:F0F1-type ATP synthase epsilon subunit
VEGPEGVKRFVVHGGFLFKERDETIRVLTREALSFEEIDPSELRARIEGLEAELEEVDAEKGGASYEKKRSELERARLSLRLIENE